MPLVSLRDNDYTLDVADFEESYPRYQPPLRHSGILTNTSPPTNIASALVVEDVSVLTCDTSAKQNHGLSAGESSGNISHNDLSRSAHPPSSLTDYSSKSSHHDLTKLSHQPMESKSSIRMSTMTYSDQGVGASAYYSKQWINTSQNTNKNSSYDNNITIQEDFSQASSDGEQESKSVQPDNSPVEVAVPTGYFQRRNNFARARANNLAKNDHNTSIPPETHNNKSTSLEEGTLLSNTLITVKHKNKSSKDIEPSIKPPRKNSSEPFNSKVNVNNSSGEGKGTASFDSPNSDYIRQLEEQVAKLSFDLATCQSQLDVQRLKYEQQLSNTQRKLEEKENAIQGLEHKLQMMQQMSQTRSTLDPYHKAAHVKAATEQHMKYEKDVQKRDAQKSRKPQYTSTKDLSEHNQTSQTSVTSTNSSVDEFQSKNSESEKSDKGFMRWGDRNRNESSTSLWRKMRMDSIQFTTGNQMDDEDYDNDDPFATYSESIRIQSSSQSVNSREETNHPSVQNRRERRSIFNGWKQRF